MSDEQTAVLLIAHGSRRQEANDDLVRLAEMIRGRSAYRAVEIAYLELAEPTIPQGIDACVAQGAQQTLLMPYFLSAGAHVTQDLKRHCRESAERYPGVKFHLCPPVGLHPLIVEIVLDRLNGTL